MSLFLINSQNDTARGYDQVTSYEAQTLAPPLWAGDTSPLSLRPPEHGGLARPGKRDSPSSVTNYQSAGAPRRSRSYLKILEVNVG